MKGFMLLLLCLIAYQVLTNHYVNINQENVSVLRSLLASER